ncbi:serine/threonine protein kinase [Fortiea contorta]|uniref:serine/threonine protein kinase n=1 Tax=Fortiea contorta TaxID=1892405 RepID=UPI000345675E|nr:serine/threonine-protein kinase [Fortiea contorta]
MGLDVRNGYDENISFNNHQHFFQKGYQVIRELGRNREAGRIIYLAHAFNSHQLVVIKEFCFAKTFPDCSGLQAYEHEIQILQQLHHPRIPHYVASFTTPAGFYLVQEYKNAPSLGAKHNFHPEQIKHIALSILEILVYLQNQTAPIIHRDIKPENILVDQHLRTYLIDFGLAKKQDITTVLSSLSAGTPGFMSPEEQFGDFLTTASDLYSLGATLICLLTHTRAVDIGKLIDENLRFNFHKLVPNINPRFCAWLMKMVEPNRKHRYPNAEIALKTLQPIPVFGGTKIEMLATVVKLRKSTTMLALATMGTLAVAGTTWIIAQPGGLAQQVLETHECQSSQLVSKRC